MHPRVPVAVSPCRLHGEPHLFGDAGAVRHLQQEIVGQAELHLDNGQRCRFTGADSDDVATFYLAFHGENQLLPGSA